MTLNSRQQDILLHMTGLDRGKVIHRNHFFTDKAGQDYDDLMALCAAGMVTKPIEGDSSVWGSGLFFYTTLAGVIEAKAIAAKRQPKEGDKVEPGTTVP